MKFHSPSALLGLPAVRKTIFFSSVIALYAVLTIYYYMGDAAFNCSGTLPAGIGDATSGMIWLNSVSPALPWWGFTDVSNFPFGEQLGQPFHIIGQTIFSPFWLISKLTGPVCAYTLVTSLGFVSSAMLMFLFIRWLTACTWIAVIAGLAVAFTPYLQYKTGFHPSYAFQGMFIGFIWLFLIFWKHPTWKKSAGLGAIIGLFFYTDPYFILLGGILAGSLTLFASAMWIVGKNNKEGLFKRLRFIPLTGLVVALFITPIAFIQFHYGKQIQSVVSNSRSDIAFEAQVYGARPSEYFLPDSSHPILGSVLGPTFGQRDQHGSNPAETKLSISLTLLTISIFALVLLVRQRIIHRKIPANWHFQNFSPIFLLAVFVGTGILAFLVSLPPQLFGIPLPSGIIIDLTQIWRVFARLQVIVTICLVIVGAISLAILTTKNASRLRSSLLILLVAVGVLFEYQTAFPRQTWSYTTAPPAYTWLKQQETINAIAEYPLDEPAKTDFPSYYSTYQIIHKKHMLNATVAGSPQAALRNAIRDLRAPQTAPALRALGIQAVLVHSILDPGPLPGFEQISTPQSATGTAAETVWVYRVLPGEKLSQLVAPGKGFDDLKVKATIKDVVYEAKKHAELSFLPLPGSLRNATRGNLHLTLTTLAPDNHQVKFLQNGVTLWTGMSNISQNITLPVTAHPDQPVIIETTANTIETVIGITHISYTPTP